MIYKLKLKHKEKLNIKWMCEISGVSRSGYYNYVKNLTSSKYLLREEKDKEDFELIMQAYKFKNRHKGARAIKMTLERQYGIIMNLKKIRRLMRKFNLKCPIRKANPYRKMAKALKTNNYHDNKINREFYNGNPGEKLLTDITYIFYGPNRDVAYLSTIKDSVTTEILAYKLSSSLEEQFVLDTVNQLIIDNKVPITENTTLHSDQGCHYTTIAFQKLLKDLNIIQSMSRRGNCWDNAPQESFFGHMKDEIDISNCETFEQIKLIIIDYMDYYNDARPQWGLAYLTPTEYFDYAKTGRYPIEVKYLPIKK